ncbi:hypothetical protein BsWGS_03884 [Bradybaena similaris]
MATIYQSLLECHHPVPCLASVDAHNIIDDSQVGDLGLGMSNHEQMTIFPTRVNLPGVKGEKV